MRRSRLNTSCVACARSFHTIGAYRCSSTGRRGGKGQRDGHSMSAGYVFVSSWLLDSQFKIEFAMAGLKSAAWGGLMTARAQFRGVKGVVVDGRCRDLAEHREAGFPVGHAGHSATLDADTSICVGVRTLSFDPRAITIHPTVYSPRASNDSSRRRGRLPTDHHQSSRSCCGRHGRRRRRATCRRGEGHRAV